MSDPISYGNGDRSPIQTLDPLPYPLRTPEAIPTPRLLVFRTHVEENLRRMAAILEGIAPGSGFAHLCPHVKTHKSSWVTGLMREAGISSFKATPNEVEMLLRAGVTDLFIAYPLLPQTAEKVAQLARQHPQATLSVQVSHPEHVAVLRQVARRHGLTWNAFLDVDVGMGRTGATPAAARSVYDLIRSAPELRFVGVHGYDGHNHTADASERQRVSTESMGVLMSVIRSLREMGATVERIVVGGSPSFEPDLRYLLHEANLDAHVQVSPGTWIYWDTKYDGLMPGRFVIAAVILAQVMDLPAPERITLNLGHKRWAIDQGPVHVFSEPGLKVVSTSEEHTVLECSRSAEFRIGDPVMIAPQHVCSTVNLWEFATVIGPDGEIEIERCPVDARNR